MGFGSYFGIVQIRRVWEGYGRGGDPPALYAAVAWRVQEHLGGSDDEGATPRADEHVLDAHGSSALEHGFEA